MLCFILVLVVCVGLLLGCVMIKELVNKVGLLDMLLVQVFKECLDLCNELVMVEICQYFNMVEFLIVVEVKVIEIGLLDDLVKLVCIVYNFKLVDGDWEKIVMKIFY